MTEIKEILGISDGRSINYSGNYGAKEALELLKDLGLETDDPDYRWEFHKYWAKACVGNGQDSLSMVCQIYTILPFILNQEELDKEIRKQREEEFTRRVNLVRPEKWMHE